MRFGHGLSHHAVFLTYRWPTTIRAGRFRGGRLKLDGGTQTQALGKDLRSCGLEVSWTLKEPPCEGDGGRSWYETGITEIGLCRYRAE